MAKVRTAPTVSEMYGPARLIIPKEKFKQTIKDRINSGRDLYDEEIRREEELEELKQKYSKWDHWNREFLKVSYSYQENPYLEEYESIGMVFVGGYREIYLSEKIKDLKDDIKKKMHIGNLAKQGRSYPY